MKVYTVTGLYSENDDEPCLFLYGCFTDKEKANKIASRLKNTVSEDEIIEVHGLILDEPSEEYYFMTGED